MNGLLTNVPSCPTYFADVDSVYDPDSTDGFITMLSQNTLTSGAPEMGGGADGAAGESGTRSWQ